MLHEILSGLAIKVFAHVRDGIKLRIVQRQAHALGAPHPELARRM